MTAVYNYSPFFLGEGSMMAPEQPSSSLLGGMQEGDPAAYERFVAAYGPFIVRICRRYTRSEADDLMHEVLLKLYEILPKFHLDRERSFKAWLFVVTRNAAADFVNASKRSKVLPAIGGSDALELMVQQPDSGAIDIDAFAEEVTAKLSSIDSLSRQAFRRDAFDQLTRRLRNKVRLEAFLAIKALGEGPKMVGDQLEISDSAASMAAKELLEKLSPVICSRIEKILELAPSAKLSEEALKQLSPGQWHRIEEDMSRLLEDLWDVVGRRKLPSEIEETTGMPLDLIGQAVVKVKECVDELADQLSQADLSSHSVPSSPPT
jgi:RNA polymerase sigma factor (sigma-70 family)